MKNNKGFTLIELAVTFSLISVVVVLLFQIIVSLRELYISGNIKTTLLSKQGIMLRKINDDLQNRILTKIDSCGTYCITFHYADGVNHDLKIDPQKQMIHYYNYSWQLDEASKIGQVTTEQFVDPTITNTAYDNGILKIHIPVTNKLLDGDFGLTIQCQYRTNSTVIPTTIVPPDSVDINEYNQYAFFR